MTKILASVALSLLSTASCVAAAQATAPAAVFHTQLIARYCAKLNESPEAYVHHVRRLLPIHGYTYADFAPAYPGAPVKADCRATPERVAAVNARLQAMASLR